MGVMKEKIKEWSFAGSLQMQVLLVTSFAGLTILTILTSILCLSSPQQPQHHSHKHDLLVLRTPVRKPRLYSIDNETLFSIVVSEPNAENEKNQIKELLETGGYDANRSLRSSWIRSRRRDGRDGEDRERRRGSNGESWPLRLSAPQFAPFWPKFRMFLNAWVANKRYEPKVMHSLVLTIKEPIDRHYKALDPNPHISKVSSDQELNIDPSPWRYATCAVVGNSGIVLNRTYGEEIDRHDMVLRLNNARTSSFEKYVGVKTTIAFMNSNILHQCARRVRCFCHPYGDNIPIVMYISQVHHFMDVAMCSPAHRAPLIVTDPRLDTLTSRIIKHYSVREFVEQTGQSIADWISAHDGLKGFHYSSGMQAVMLALGICDKVDLFGFGKSNSTKHHYHTAQQRELNIHDYEAEYCFYDDLVAGRVEDIPFLSDAEFRIPPVRVFE